MENFILQTLTDGCRSIMRINTHTGELNLYKVNGEMWPTPEIPVQGQEFLNSTLKENYIYEDDLWQFEYLLIPELMANRYLKDLRGSVMVYRRKIGNTLTWVRATLILPQDFSAENPYILFYSRDMNQGESAFYETCELIAERLHKIVKLNMTTGSFFPLKIYPAEAAAHQKYNVQSSAEEIAYIRDSYVHPEDEKAFSTYLDYNNIREYFHAGKTDYQCYYRRRIGPLFRWVRLTVIPSLDYKEGINDEFFFIVEDVHQSILKMLNSQSAANFASYYSMNAKNVSMAYYENVLQALTLLTEPYVDYYVIDLERDLYIKYKTPTGLLKDSIPNVGNYSQTSTEFINTHYSGDIAKELLTFASSKKLQKLLKNTMSLEYTYPAREGKKYRTSIIKLESRRGVPVRALSSTVVCPDSNLLVVKTFGNFSLSRSDGTPVTLPRRQSRELLAYLIDKNGFPVTSKDIVEDILEKSPDDMAAVKYVSTMVKRAMDDLAKAGFPDVIRKDGKSILINLEAVDCDYYHLLRGDSSYWLQYHNEYMKEYSWAEATNGEILRMSER